MARVTSVRRTDCDNGAVSAAAAQATPYTVNTLNDSNGAGNCSLRDAINAANGSPTSGSTCTAPGTGTDTINFSVNGPISLGSTLPTITDANLTISGPTASPGTTVDGGNTHEVMDVSRGTTLNIANLTIANGSGEQGGGIYNDLGALTVTNSTFTGNSAFGGGGGIYNAHGTLTVTNSTFSGNSAGTGGGIENEGGTLTVTNSTFSGNSATQGGAGGGIFNLGTLTVTNSTFSGNTATQGSLGGGIYNGNTLTVTNSTFSGNSASVGGGSIFNDGTATFKGTILAASTQGGNCRRTITDAGYNLSDDNSCGFSATGSANNVTTLNLDPSGLHNNGGPTETIALKSGSAAIAQIPVADCTDQATPPNRLTTDQRGYVRPSPAHPATCDIGAYEDNSTPFCSGTNLGNALNFALESVGGDVTTGTNASVGKGTAPAGSVAGLGVSLGNSSGVGQDAISSSSSLVLGTNANVSGACVTGGSPITISGSAARCGSTDTSGTNPLLTTYSESGTDASTFETAVIDATPTQSIGGFTLATAGSRTLTDSVVGGFNLVRINGDVARNNSSSLTLKGAAGDTLVVDITGNLSLGTNSHIQLSGLSPNQVVIKVRGAISNWGNSSSINGTLLALDSDCAAGINDSVNGAVICGRDATFGSSLRVGFNPATNVCVP
jgi:CSLREA domain-containing protein